MRVLITAATRHDATRGIAEAIGSGLAEHGFQAEVRPIDEVQDLSGYDAVVLGSAVYIGRWLKPARTFAEHNATALSAVPVWLFSSGPLGPRGHLVPGEEPTDISMLMKLTRARQHRMFAGRLESQRLGFAERVAVKAVHAPEGDWRDFSAISDFVGEIAAQLAAADCANAGTHERAIGARLPNGETFARSG